MHAFPQSFCVSSSSDNMASPRNKSWKVGTVGNRHPTGGPHPSWSPPEPDPKARKAFSWATSFTSPLPCFSPCAFPFLLPKKKASGSWLPLPSNQTGCHWLRGVAQMVPNEGVEMRGVESKSLSPVLSHCQQCRWCLQSTHFLKCRIVFLFNEKPSKVIT